MDDLVKRWCEDNLGKATTEIDTNTRAKKESLLLRLRFMKNLLKELEDRDVFYVDGKSIIDKSKDVPIIIIIGRLANWFPNMSAFRRVAEEVCPIIRNILKMDPNELCAYLKATTRNASFQKKLIEDIDTKCKAYTEKAKERRCFTIAEKKKKLEEQGGKCSMCEGIIYEYQRTAGDHIVEYCIGGSTSYDNLQIVHKLCHEKKNII